MPKWKNVKIRQELLEQVEKELQKGQKGERLPSLSEFVSDAIRLRVETMTKERIREYLEREKQKLIVEIQPSNPEGRKEVEALLSFENTKKNFRKAKSTNQLLLAAIRRLIATISPETSRR